MANTKEGKKFEQDWRDSYKSSEHFYMRLRDGAKWLKGQESSYQSENQCDAIQHTMPFLWLLELKSTKGASVSFNPYIEGESAPDKKPKNRKTNVMIKANQVKELRQSVTYQGVISGFVINYRERKLKTKTYENASYFIHINDFWDFAVKTGKSSISQDDCKTIGVKIGQTRLKNKYIYKIDQFINECLKLYIEREYINKANLKKTIKWLNELAD